MKHSKPWFQEKRAKLLDSIASFNEEIIALEGAEDTAQIKRQISRNKSNLEHTHDTLRRLEGMYATNIAPSTDVDTSSQQGGGNVEHIAQMERTRLPVLGEDPDILPSIVGQVRNNSELLPTNVEFKYPKPWFEARREKLLKSIETLKKLIQKSSFVEDTVQTQVKTKRNKDALQKTRLTLRYLESHYAKVFEK